MFDILQKIIRTGTVTDTSRFPEAAARYKGKPIITSDPCSGCGECAASCPAEAIRFDVQDSAKAALYSLELSYVNCIYCGVCADVCQTKTIQITNEYRLANKNKGELLQRIEGFIQNGLNC